MSLYPFQLSSVFLPWYLDSQNNSICSCGLIVIAARFQPVLASFTHCLSHSHAERQKNAKLPCLALNSSPSMYRLPLFMSRSFRSAVVLPDLRSFIAQVGRHIRHGRHGSQRKAPSRWIKRKWCGHHAAGGFLAVNPQCIICGSTAMPPRVVPRFRLNLDGIAAALWIERGFSVGGCGCCQRPEGGAAVAAPLTRNRDTRQRKPM